MLLNQDQIHFPVRPDYRPIKIWTKYLYAGFVYLVISIVLFFHTGSLDEIVIDYSDCLQGTSCTKNFTDLKYNR